MCKNQEIEKPTPFYKTRTFLYGAVIVVGVAVGYLVAIKKLSLGSIIDKIKGPTSTEN